MNVFQIVLEHYFGAFCDRITVKEYLDKCFFLLLKSSSILLQFYVRLDVAHKMHIINCWTCIIAVAEYDFDGKMGQQQDMFR